MIPGWDKDTKDEYLQILQEIGSAVPRDFAMRLGVSECCAVYWLTELARQGRLRITGVEAVKEGDVPCAPESFVSCQRKVTCPAGAVSSDEPWSYAM
jgi:hypothetical protein